MEAKRDREQAREPREHGAEQRRRERQRQHARREGGAEQPGEAMRLVVVLVRARPLRNAESL